MRVRVVGPEVPTHKKLEFLNGFFQVAAHFFLFFCFIFIIGSPSNERANASCRVFTLFSSTPAPPRSATTQVAFHPGTYEAFHAKQPTGAAPPTLWLAEQPGLANAQAWPQEDYSSTNNLAEAADAALGHAAWCVDHGGRAAGPGDSNAPSACR